MSLSARRGPEKPQVKRSHHVLRQGPDRSDAPGQAGSSMESQDAATSKGGGTPEKQVPSAEAPSTQSQGLADDKSSGAVKTPAAVGGDQAKGNMPHSASLTPSSPQTGHSTVDKPAPRIAFAPDTLVVPGQPNAAVKVEHWDMSQLHESLDKAYDTRPQQQARGQPPKRSAPAAPGSKGHGTGGKPQGPGGQKTKRIAFAPNMLVVPGGKQATHAPGKRQFQDWDMSELHDSLDRAYDTPEDPSRQDDGPWEEPRQGYRRDQPPCYDDDNDEGPGPKADSDSSYTWESDRYGKGDSYTCGDGESEGAAPHLVLLLRGSLSLPEWGLGE